MPHPLSLAFLTLPDTPPVQVIAAAARAGFAAVGLRMLPAATHGEGPYPLLSDKRLLTETQAALRDTGLFVADVEIVRLAAILIRRRSSPFWNAPPGWGRVMCWWRAMIPTGRA